MGDVASVEGSGVVIGAGGPTREPLKIISEQDQLTGESATGAGPGDVRAGFDIRVGVARGCCGDVARRDVGAAAAVAR
ncbi:MAG: hypothetical protein JWR82_640 [Blastococcus sp.]|nr:hypothetical protein [Blastococcus sp.]